jgi:hypothetical protein
MKKIELSESVSNLLLVSSVFVAFTPLMLGGDGLIQIIGGGVKEAAVMIDQFGAFLTALLS